MELKGLAKQGRIVSIAMASFGMALGVTAPVAVAQDAETWEMPNFRGELLQRAIDQVNELAGPENVKFNLADRGMNQVVYNYTNWVVCGQSPAADKEVTINPAKPQLVGFGLRRPAEGC